MLNGCFVEWSKRDKVLFGAMTAFKTIDILQTREALSNDNFYEINPIMENMTPNQSTAYMVGTWGLVYLLADYIPKYRTLIIMVPLAISAACVMNNFSIGVRF